MQQITVARQACLMRRAGRRARFSGGRANARSDAIARSPPLKGSTHLLGARRAHAPLGLVGLETRHLEVEPDELQNPAHLGLEVFDQLLLLHAQYLARIGQAAPGRHLIPTGFSMRLASLVQRGTYWRSIRGPPPAARSSSTPRRA